MIKYFITRYRQYRGKMNLPAVRKVGIAIAGGGVMVVGIAMLVLPGPAFIVIPLGLAILASEFNWAKRGLKKARAMLPRRKKRSAASTR